MRFLGMILISALPGLGQRPAISPGGVVNAASYSVQGWCNEIAPGSIASIFGENLSPVTQQASSVPQPKELGGVTVTLSGVAAPIFYVSPKQINFQVPANPPYAPQLQVTTAAGSSEPYGVGICWGFSLFTLDGSGCGRAAVLNVHRDGSVSVNSADDAVSPGEMITVFGTGAGTSLSVPVPDGDTAPADPPARHVGFSFGAGYVEMGKSISSPREAFAGRAPGLVGVDQVNFQVPDDVPDSCSVPLWVSSLGLISQLVPLSVRRGGGACVDPPEASYAELRGAG